MPLGNRVSLTHFSVHETYLTFMPWVITDAYRALHIHVCMYISMYLKYVQLAFILGITGGL